MWIVSVANVELRCFKLVYPLSIKNTTSKLRQYQKNKMTPKSNLKNRTDLNKDYLKDTDNHKDTDDLKMKTTFKLKCQIR